MQASELMTAFINVSEDLEKPTKLQNMDALIIYDRHSDQLTEEEKESLLTIAASYLRGEFIEQKHFEVLYTDFSQIKTTKIVRR